LQDLKAYRKAYYIKNKAAIRLRQQTKEYKAVKAAYDKIYRQTHKKQKNRYLKLRRRNDLKWRLKRALIISLPRMLRRNGFAKKSSSTFDLIGCNIEFLKQHLERQFLKGMTWKNYGKWHIDHIKPCTAFDLHDPIQQRECFHWTNLQPLWSVDNIRKGSLYNGIRHRHA